MKNWIMGAATSALIVLTGCSTNDLDKMAERAIGTELKGAMPDVPASRLSERNMAEFKNKLLPFNKDCFYDNLPKSDRNKPAYPFPDDFTVPYQHFELVGVVIDNGFPEQFRLRTTSNTYKMLIDPTNGPLREQTFSGYAKTLLLQRAPGDNPAVVAQEVQDLFLNAPLSDFERVTTVTQIKGLPDHPLNLKFYYFSNVTFRSLTSEYRFSKEVPHRVASGNQSRQRYVPPYFSPEMGPNDMSINFVYMSDAKKIVPRDCAYVYDLAMIGERGGIENPIVFDPGEGSDESPPPNTPPSWP